MRAEREVEIDATIHDHVSTLRVMSAMADDISDSIDSSDALAVPAYIEDEDSLVIELKAVRRKSRTTRHNIEQVATAAKMKG